MYELICGIKCGTKTVKAAKILHWHIDILRQQGERHIFRPKKDAVATREQRQAWLRRMLWMALPMRERKARELVADVTPPRA